MVYMRFIKREVLIVKIFFLLMRRDASKYFKIASSTYILGAFFICRGAKNSYFFCRAVDDMADGDVPTDYYGYTNFSTMIARLKFVIHQEEKPKTALEILADSSASHNNGEIKSFLLHFLDAMLVEYHRRIEKRLSTRLELEKIHRDSFDPVLRIAFVAFNTNYSDYIIESLTLIQSKVYSIQDLEEDLKNGIYNFPSEVVGKIPSSISELKDSPKFREWMQLDLGEARNSSLELLKHRYPKKTQRVVDTLVLPVLEDIKVLLKD